MDKDKHEPHVLMVWHAQAPEVRTTYRMVRAGSVISVEKLAMDAMRNECWLEVDLHEGQGAMMAIYALGFSIDAGKLELHVEQPQR